jgi:hypothetical protein
VVGQGVVVEVNDSFFEGFYVNILYSTCHVFPVVRFSSVVTVLQLLFRPQ